MSVQLNGSNSDITVNGTGWYTTSTATAMPAPADKPNRIRTVTIIQIDYGYEVSVGCQVFAFESDKTLIKYLTEYLANPEKTEEKYHQNKLFKK